MWVNVVLILGSYLLGSSPHLRLLARLRHVELDGDFHQNLWARAGKIAGVSGVVGEFVKGALPVLIGRSLDLSMVILAIAGLAAVCGQMWPVFSKFDGEKGNSIALAMVIALVPRSGLIALIPVVIAVLFRTIPRLLAKAKSAGDRHILGGAPSISLPLGMGSCFLLLPFLAWYFGEPAEVVGCLGALFILLMIRRLTAGLRHDLKSGGNVRKILINRLLFDRATGGWRQ
jgi:glycerol-3-phosphate acyltransferase PlsY